MHIPFILAKLEDPRAISVLIEMIEKPMRYQNNDSDSSDEEIFLSVEISRLTQQSCLALTSFYRRVPFLNDFLFIFIVDHDEKVKQVLIKGIQNEQIHQSCLVALCISTLEEQYFNQITQILNEGDTLDSSGLQFLYHHRNK